MSTEQDQRHSTAEQDIIIDAKMASIQNPLTEQQIEKLEKLAGIIDFKDCTQKSTDQLRQEQEESATKNESYRSSVREHMNNSILRLKENKMDHQEIDSLLRISGYNQNGEFNDLIIEALDSFTRISLYRQGWMHSVCHNFENYKFTLDQFSGTIFDQPTLYPAIERLLNNAVERELKFHDSCFSRVMEGVLPFNLSKVTSENLEEKFILKPDRLADPKFIQVLDLAREKYKQTEWYSDYIDTDLIFCKARTPKEYIELLIADQSTLFSLNPANKHIMELYSRKYNNLDLGILFQKASLANKLEIPNATEACDNFLKSITTADIQSGLFVDVDGTLIHDGKLHQTLTTAIDALYPDSSKVTVFTGGDPELATQKLKELGFPERFLPVKSKSNFRGLKLETLYDDTDATVQGFKAETMIRARNYSAIPELVKLDQQGILARYLELKAKQ